MIREVVFLGRSRKDLLAMPEAAIDLFGYALDRAQRDLVHKDAKKLKGFEKQGVYEIVYEDGDAYRVMYAAKIGVKIYVLHCFQKKSPRGSKTPKPDLETLEARLQLARRDAEGDDDEQ